MRIALLSRYPRVDVPSWKRDLAARIAAGGHEVGVLYSRAPLADHVRAGLREFGPSALGRYVAAATGRSERGAETLAEWVRARDLRVMLHRRLGDADTVSALRAFGPDLLVLTGADIVPEAILAVPSVAAINPHYGLLPGYRGMNVTEWSIYNDDPVGVSIHHVTRGIDTGDILATERLRVARGDDLESLREKHQRAAGRLLAETVERIAAGDAAATPQALEEGRQYYRMHPRLRAIVERRLAAGTYRWIGEA